MQAGVTVMDVSQIPSEDANHACAASRPRSWATAVHVAADSKCLKANPTFNTEYLHLPQRPAVLFLPSVTSSHPLEQTFNKSGWLPGFLYKLLIQI